MSENFTDQPIITSIHNPLVRRIASLYKSKDRHEQGTTLLEGYQILKVALDSSHAPQEILFDPHNASNVQDDLFRARDLGSKLIPVSKEVLSRLSKREGPLDLIATIAVPKVELPSVSLKNPATILVAEGIEKPGNLGVLIRTASAAAADVFISVDSQADAFDPGSVSASLGAVFTTPVVETSSEEAIKWLKLQNFTPIVTSPHAKEFYYQKNLTSSVAIVIGNEHRGVSKNWLELGIPVRIPISPQMDSLNATTAAGIVLFETLRQRASS